jgi:phytoene dehydrogenase-like protein
MLLQKGFNVTILEARDRIGGRMHQTRLPSGHLVDLGPNVSNKSSYFVALENTFSRLLGPVSQVLLLLVEQDMMLI